MAKVKLQAGDEKFQQNKLDKTSPEALQTQYRAYGQLLAMALLGYRFTAFLEGLALSWIASIWCFL